MNKLPKGFRYGFCGPCKDSINGFDNYEISESGDVYALNTSLPEWNHVELIKPRIDRGGYPTVRLSKDGKTHTRFLHRLLAEAFIPNPLGLPEVNHKNGNKLDCRLKNLEWCTHSGNVQHAYDTSLIRRREKRVLNTTTGQVYQSVKLASLASGFKYSSLKNALNGNRENRTGLEYIKTRNERAG